MRIIADLHIHSKYSRATSAKLTPPYLDHWARVKGISLLGSGDCTHPVWLSELRENLDDAEEGFFTLKEDVRRSFCEGPALSEALPKPTPPESVPESANKARFVLTGEISTIYKKGGKTRKIHHVVILPDFKAAAAFQIKLEQRGNIRSDGRPILGLDSHDLLTMLLDADERSILIPAHIWTPWFSALGANSGFDSIQECYGDLSSYIPAVETGLSSNPPMNWALESLDGFSIVSNSDAHSPDKLGREATILEMELSYRSFAKSLKDKSHRDRILGTIEFFPQEGKYHYDGHRACKVFLDPEDADHRDGICPVCHRPLTPGVMGRVLDLADRPVDETAPCPQNGRPNCKPYYSLIPLKEILGELLGTGSSSKKVESAYGVLIEKAGSEFAILLDMATESIGKLSCPGLSAELLSSAIDRMRRGEVFISPGYDGEYGVIRTFDPGTFSAGKTREKEGLFEDAGSPDTKKSAGKESLTKKRSSKSKAVSVNKPRLPLSLNEDQSAAVNSKKPKALIIAGPGTGKTALLAVKISNLIREGLDADFILALSFTVKAAAELRERIEAQKIPRVSTFHSLCASILRDQYKEAALPADFGILGEAERTAILEDICTAKRGAGQPNVSTRHLSDYIEERKRFLFLPKENIDELKRILPSSLISLIPDRLQNIQDSVFEQLYEEYRNRLRSSGMVDYDGLIAGTVRLLALREDLLTAYRNRFRHIFVDEYQDINFAQYALIRLLAPAEKDSPSLWVIGDPNQAIYGFRGSDKAFIDRFQQDYPEAACFTLQKSFRCSQPIIEAAGRLTHTVLEGVSVAETVNEKTGLYTVPVSLFRREYRTEKSEAEGIARTIASLLGGTSFYALDSGAAGQDGYISQEDLAPEDCAVLVRTAALAEPITKALNDHGIPFDEIESSWWDDEPVKLLIAFLKERNSAALGNITLGVTLNVTPNLTSVEVEVLNAWETLSKEKSISPKKKNAAIPESISRFIHLAKFFGTVQTLLDTLSTSQGAGVRGALGMATDISHGVRVMTIHASKGLEFDHVFVAGLEEGMLPFTLYEDSGNEEALSEERRLLYVAMTRARKGLWLSHAASRYYRGRVLKAPASRFLSELASLVLLLKEEKTREEKTIKRDSQMSLF
ncbi:MAG: UvrD-helicase domain-containing protein [Treponema sp.]|jgi:uncharacterized protein (TIGR00375 family)|nr:UvrD-helicase domain-containing protein [Treponema sp.]